jgi:WD40 repeat protein
MKNQIGFDSICSSVRAMAINDNRLLVGTLGAEIYELNFDRIDSLATIKPFLGCTNIVKGHYSPNNTWTNEVWGLHVHNDIVFTCADDATVRCWSISKRKQLSCVSNNTEYVNGRNLVEMEKDKKTNDFTDSAKGRAICVSPDGGFVVVGSKDGTVRVFSFSPINYEMKTINVFKHAQ